MLRERYNPNNTELNKQRFAEKHKNVLSKKGKGIRFTNEAAEIEDFDISPLKDEDLGHIDDDDSDEVRDESSSGLQDKDKIELMQKDAQSLG